MHDCTEVVYNADRKWWSWGGGWERKTGQAAGGLYMPIEGNKIKGLGRFHIGFGSLLVV
jgi:hypothetical protein